MAYEFTGDGDSQMFAGHYLPIRQVPGTNQYVDADGRAVAPDVAAAYAQASQARPVPQAADVFTPEQRAANNTPTPYTDQSNPANQPQEGAAVLYGGFTPPFTLSYDGGVHWVDATGRTASPEAVKQWEAHGKPAGTGASGQVTSVDMKLALDQYREAIGKSNTQYDAILGHEVTPPATDVLNKPLGSTVDTTKVAQVANGQRVGSAVDASKVAQVGTGARVGSQVDPSKVAQVGASERLGSMVDPSKVAMLTPAERLQAALGRTTTVEGTTLDTAQSEQARALGISNISDLQATAQGAGAGQLAAAARLQLALQRSSQLASGMAAQARGSERRGARRDAMLSAGERNLEAQSQLEAQAAGERMTAQGQLGTAIQSTRATDVDVSAKRAALDSQRKTLQAELDGARARGDQDATNAINVKMADLAMATKSFNASAANATQARSEDQAFAGQKTNIEVAQRRGEVNAAAANTAQGRSEDQAFAGQQSGADREQQARALNAAATNATQARSEEQTFAGQQSGADRDQRTGETNAAATNAAQARSEAQAFEGQQADVQRGLDVSKLAEDQRVANERLKLDASKAAQDAAAGLLTENARQNQLDLANREMAAAKDQADRQFWGNIISSLLSGVATGAAAGITKSDRRAKEDIKPVNDADLGELAQAVRKSLATWKYRQGEGPPGERAGPMAQDIEKTRLGRAVVSEDESGTKGIDYAQLATLLAAATVKSRKGEAR